jgi:hypothetical protein
VRWATTGVEVAGFLSSRPNAGSGPGSWGFGGEVKKFGGSHWSPRGVVTSYPAPPDDWCSAPRPQARRHQNRSFQTRQHHRSARLLSRAVSRATVSVQRILQSFPGGSISGQPSRRTPSRSMSIKRRNTHVFASGVYVRGHAGL